MFISQTREVVQTKTMEKNENKRSHEEEVEGEPPKKKSTDEAETKPRYTRQEMQQAQEDVRHHLVESFCAMKDINIAMVKIAAQMEGSTRALETLHEKMREHLYSTSEKVLNAAKGVVTFDNE